MPPQEQPSRVQASLSTPGALDKFRPDKYDSDKSRSQFHRNLKWCWLSSKIRKSNYNPSRNVLSEYVMNYHGPVNNVSSPGKIHIWAQNVLACCTLTTYSCVQVNVVVMHHGIWWWCWLCIIFFQFHVCP